MAVLSFQLKVWNIDAGNQMCLSTWKPQCFNASLSFPVSIATVCFFKERPDRAACFHILPPRIPPPLPIHTPN